MNGEVRQNGNSRGMLNPVVPPIQHTVRYFSLQAGGAVLTGTSSGVGSLNNDDGLLPESSGASRLKTHVL